MLTLKLKGGLGNQMFQYALGRKLSLKNNIPLCFDIEYLLSDPLRCYRLDVYSLPEYKIYGRPHYFRKKWNKFKKKHHIQYYEEPHFNFDEKVLDIKQGTIEGYWQSEKYFLDIRSILLEEFTPKIILAQAHKFIEHIQKTNSVSVHIRRGDYANNPAVTAIHGVLPLEYYHVAMNYMKQHVAQPQFFFFSDDIEWVKKHFKKEGDTHFIELGLENAEYMDIYLMSCCKHQIIANSSFSWWGAWLNQNIDKIVIAPEQWFATEDMNTQDILPNNWLRF